jgi:hypothetical protein
MPRNKIFGFEETYNKYVLTLALGAEYKLF